MAFNIYKIYLVSTFSTYLIFCRKQRINKTAPNGSIKFHVTAQKYANLKFLVKDLLSKLNILS